MCLVSAELGDGVDGNSRLAKVWGRRGPANCCGTKLRTWKWVWIVLVAGVFRLWGVRSSTRRRGDLEPARSFMRGAEFTCNG
jgi:hypothetical protein